MSCFTPSETGVAGIIGATGDMRREGTPAAPVVVAGTAVAWVGGGLAAGEAGWEQPSISAAAAPETPSTAAFKKILRLIFICDETGVDDLKWVVILSC